MPRAFTTVNNNFVYHKTIALKISLTIGIALAMFFAVSWMAGSISLFAQSNEEQPTPEASTQAITEAGNASADAASSDAQIATIIYVVQRGDTLGHIARRYQTNVPTLLRLNPQIRNPNRLAVGQRLRVPAPASQPDGYTTTRIHLISLDDGGTLGCGDTLVPVTVEIAPTRAVLRATLELLLSLKTQFYGQSGLYNALYQSQLTLGEVRIDNRIATIHLSGQLVQGGVCDTPRIQAQLTHAALQFPTVAQVRIYVNGTLLGDALN